MSDVREKAIEAAWAEADGFNGDVGFFRKDDLERAIAAYEGALWQPIADLPANSYFIAQKDDGRLEIIQTNSMGHWRCLGASLWNIPRAHKRVRPLPFPPPEQTP